MSPATGVRLPLGKGTPRTLLVVHIVSAGAWIGIDVVLGVLVLTALLGTDPAVAALCLQVLPLVFWPVLTAGLVCLASGIASGRGTRFGLLRYWWVAVKLVINVVLGALVALVLRSGLDETAERGAAGGADRRRAWAPWSSRPRCRSRRSWSRRCSPLSSRGAGSGPPVARPVGPFRGRQTGPASLRDRRNRDVSRCGPHRRSP